MVNICQGIHNTFPLIKYSPFAEHLYLVQHFIVLTGDSIQLELRDTDQDIFQASIDEMATMGEWQLVGIKSEKVTVPILEGSSYDELHFFVRKLCSYLMFDVN